MNGQRLNKDSIDTQPFNRIPVGHPILLQLPRLETRRLASLLLGVSFVALVSTSARADSGSLTGLGSLGGNGGGYESEINGDGVSSDGTVVVGDAILADNSTDHAFRWTQAAGMVDLGTLGGIYSSADAVSADGSVVVGESDVIGLGGGSHAFRWTQAGGMVDLGTLLGGNLSAATAVSADGSVVVGYSNNGFGFFAHFYAFRWTQGDGMVSLGTLGGGNSYAYGVSADGSVVVGESDVIGIGGAGTHAFRWTQAGGMVDLGTLGGTDSGDNWVAVSADGKVVVGDSDITGDSADHAFRWTQAGGMVDLGTLGGTYSSADAVSATGKVVVGTSNLSGDSTQVAFRWTQATGMRDLNTLLTNAGVNMSGIQLQVANGISPNGQYIVGNGTFSGIQEAYLVEYIDATVSGGGGTIGGITTASDAQSSTDNLAANQRGTAIKSRATANELLGMTRPMDGGSYTYAGGMFGSAVGYTGGQYESRGVTILGGIAYGQEDYPNVTQNDGVTLAAALRYTFDDPFGDKEGSLHPYSEAGCWLAPSTAETFSRNYANGSGTSTGEGSSSTTSWAGYARGGLIWYVNAHNTLTGYGELGQQRMSFGAYSEALTSGNPFPAEVSGGVLRMDIARLGGEWTHRLDRIPGVGGQVPVSITFAGALAQSLDVQSDLAATVPGLGTSTASNSNDTWGEFGARIESRLTERLALDVDLNGTAGGSEVRTAIHGGAGLSYRF